MRLQAPYFPWNDVQKKKERGSRKRREEIETDRYVYGEKAVKRSRRIRIEDS